MSAIGNDFDHRNCPACARTRCGADHSQFLHVKKNLLQEAALGPHAKASEVNALAATLAAGIWGRTESGESA